MAFVTDALLVALVALNLSLLGSARLRTCIRIVAVQGVVLGVLPLLSPGEAPLVRLVLQAAASILLKAVIFPWLLQRAVRSVAITSEVEPYVGFPLSLLAGVALLALSVVGASRLPALPASVPRLTMPAALFTVFVGLFVIVARRKAVTQVLGFLAMENGIYVCGMAVAESEPFLVEMGILLDVFVGVFVMGIIIYHISREFDHVDSDRLSALKD
jgi:hydrogenase-4 component E